MTDFNESFEYQDEQHVEEYQEQQQEQEQETTRTRATNYDVAKREAEALMLLSSGAGTAYAASVLAEKYKVTLRQARRYVSAASYELCDEATTHELDRQAMLSLHRLDLVAGRAMIAGDQELAIKATKAHSQALSQFRRAITAPTTRFKMKTDFGFVRKEEEQAQQERERIEVEVRQAEQDAKQQMEDAALLAEYQEERELTEEELMQEQFAAEIFDEATAPNAEPPF